MKKPKSRLGVAVLALALLTLSPLFLQGPAQAQSGGGTVAPAPITLFGALTNFDVLNDTGEVAHGFEIELDGINSIGGSFSANRYGGASVVPFAGGVYVRYESSYDAAAQQFTVGTPIATDFTPTTGHQCISSIPAYQTSGCDHFGVWIAYYGGQPTNTVYRWLVEDPANPGQLIRYGTNVSIPAPVWSVAPAQNGVAVIAAQIEAPKPPRPELQFGDAQWVKIYKTEQPREVGLDELVADNPVVPEDPAEAEVVWKLIQHNPHSANSGTLRNSGGVNSGSRAVVRRYEFFKYTGAYDPLDHGAICGGDGLCNAPLDGELGDFIGAQNAAVNIGIPSITVQKVGSGTVTGAAGKINCGGSCTTTVAAGTEITLTANPGGNVFTGWSGACNGTQLTCTITVNDALVTTASFTPQFTLSVSKGSGSVASTDLGIDCGKTCSAKYLQGAVITLNATAPAGQHFVNWTGGCTGTAPTCSVTISGNTSVQANFAK